jgi:hypothetical protein
VTPATDSGGATVGLRLGRSSVRTVTVDPTLAARVAALLGQYLQDEGDGDDPAHDVDPLTAPISIQAGTALVLVRLVDAEPPVMRVFSPLLRAIESSPDLLAELNEINGHLSFLRLFWRDRTVYAATELLAASVDATSLRHACDGLAELSDYYDERLHQRFGGQLAYG